MNKQPEPLLPWTALSASTAFATAFLAFLVVRYLQRTEILVTGRWPLDLGVAYVAGITVLKRLNPKRPIVMMLLIFGPVLLSVLVAYAVAESWYVYGERL